MAWDMATDSNKIVMALEVNIWIEKAVVHTKYSAIYKLIGMLFPSVWNN